MIYAKILNTFKSELLQTTNTSLQMVKHHHPWSITEEEFIFIKEYIAKRPIKAAYEVATAFGVSACAIALGLKNNNLHGNLLTLDAYIEEQYNNCDAYKGKQKATFEDSDGYKIAGKLFKFFELDNVIRKVGWSPDDVDKVLNESKMDNIDFVFIDSQHTDACLLADFKAVENRLSEVCHIFIHDSNCASQDTLTYMIKRIKGRIATPKISYSWNLRYITNE